MSDVSPIAPINQHYLNKRGSDSRSSAKPKAADSKVQGVVRSCMTELPPSGLFVSASAPGVVLRELELDRRAQKKRRPWNKKSK